MLRSLIIWLVLMTPATAEVVSLAEGADLQAAIDALPSEGEHTIVLPAGRFTATPQPYAEPTCGNCEVLETPVSATTGFTILGKTLIIEGAGMDQTILVTGAGYGVYCENSWVTLRNLQVIGGVRDLDGQATDAAVVVKHGELRVLSCQLGPNPVPKDILDQVIVGIGGAMAREGATLDVYDCRIVDNTWDGVAYYRGSAGAVQDNWIAGGRGAGVGITWDSEVAVRRNTITDYWKGIGTFGVALATVRGNLLYDLRGWGIIAAGESHLVAEHNTVARMGNIGIARWESTATLECRHNISWGNGTSDKWVAPRVGLWWEGELPPEGPPERPVIWHNLIGGNAEGQISYDWDGTRLDDWAASGRYGTLDADPLFVGPYDFALQEGSPARLADGTVLGHTGYVMPDAG